MNIRHGFLLLTLVAAICATVWGFSWLYVRYIDKWIVAHHRATIAIIYVAVAVIVFLIGAQ